MRLPTAFASLLYLIISSRNVCAGPLVPKEELARDIDWVKHLFDRQAPCAGVYCGAQSQYCCTGGSACYTDAGNIARCGGPTAGALAAGASSLVYYTTTIVMTNLQTITSIYSTMIVAPAAATQDLTQSTIVCAATQDSCGALCCNHGVETCVVLGSCVNIGAMPTTSLYSAPLRPTGVITTVVTAISPTTTQTFIPAQSGNSTIPLGQTSGSSSLPPGTIAGIVVGVLAAVIILILLCFCCAVRAGFDGILSIFGLGDRRRETRIEVTEDRYSRHGSGPRRETHTGWFGRRGSTRVEEKKKKSSGLRSETGIIAAILLFLGGLWAILGLRKKERKAPRTETSYSSWSGSGSRSSRSSNSSPSSGQRTHRTRETRVTRDSRRVSSRR